MKRFWILFFAAAAVLSVLSGCTRGPSGQQGAQPQTPSSSAQEEKAVKNNKQQTAGISEAQRQYIMNMVLDNAGVITEPFESGADIPAYSLTRFLYTRMQKDGVASGFERSAENNTIRVPIERVRAYAQTYFNLDEVSVDFISQQFFDGQNITIPNPELLSAQRPYELQLASIEPGDGRVTVTLNLTSGGITYQKWIYTLRAGAQNQFYFASMRRRPAEYGLYAMNHATAVLESVMDVPVTAATASRFDFYTMQGSVLVSIDNGKDLRLGYLDMNTYDSKQYITIEGNGREDNVFDVRPGKETIAVYQTDKVTVLDKNLITLQEIAYPAELIGQCDTYTRRFALSPDFRYMAFADTQGLNFFNLQNLRSHVVREHPKTGRRTESIPDMIWEPMDFDESSGQLLAALRNKDVVESFGQFDVNGIRTTINIKADEESVYSVMDDRLMVYAPVSASVRGVKPSEVEEDSYVEYNLLSGAARLITHDFIRVEDEGQQDSILLSPTQIYFTNTIHIGEDMVLSNSVKAFDKTAERLNPLQFGYVDRDGRLRLKASVNKLVAVCDGMFIHAIVII